MNHKKHTTVTFADVKDTYVVSDYAHRQVFGQEAYDKFTAERKRLKRRGKTLLLLSWADGRTEQWDGATEEGKYSIQELVNIHAAFTAIRRDKLMEA